jgi:hypothetical protein
MLRKTSLGLAALALCLSLSACSKLKEPEPKMASDKGPDPRVKQQKDLSGIGGPIK